VCGVPAFFALTAHSPERIAKNWIPNINKYLNWYESAYAPLLERLESVDIPANILFDSNILDSDTVSTEKMLDTVATVLPQICDVCLCILELNSHKKTLTTNIGYLETGVRAESHSCYELIRAIESCDAGAYAEAYVKLGQMYRKYELQGHRKEMLLLLEPIAPQWVAAIKSRDGVHGSNVGPDTIELAWKWKQLFPNGYAK
jgi:hypothetical protein